MSRTCQRNLRTTKRMIALRQAFLDPRLYVCVFRYIICRFLYGVSKPRRCWCLRGRVSDGFALRRASSAAAISLCHHQGGECRNGIKYLQPAWTNGPRLVNCSALYPLFFQLVTIAVSAFAVSEISTRLPFPVVFLSPLAERVG